MELWRTADIQDNRGEYGQDFRTSGKRWARCVGRSTGSSTRLADAASLLAQLSCSGAAVSWSRYTTRRPASLPHHASRDDRAAVGRQRRACAQGFRGRPAADVEALVDTLRRISYLAVQLAERLAELEINLLMVLPAGRGTKAVDTLVVFQG